MRQMSPEQRPLLSERTPRVASSANQTFRVVALCRQHLYHIDYCDTTWHRVVQDCTACSTAAANYRFRYEALQPIPAAAAARGGGRTNRRTKCEGKLCSRQSPPANGPQAADGEHQARRSRRVASTARANPSCCTVLSRMLLLLCSAVFHRVLCCAARPITGFTDSMRRSGPSGCASRSAIYPRESQHAVGIPCRANYRAAWDTMLHGLSCNTASHAQINRRLWSIACNT